MVVRTSLTLQLHLLREALEFSLELQVRVLPYESLFDPLLRLRSFPTRTLES